MLKLTRGINEVVMVGNNVQVKVLAIDGLKVLLGFVAPKQIIVHREEVYKRIKNQQNFNQLYEINSPNFLPTFTHEYKPFLGGK